MKGRTWKRNNAGERVKKKQQEAKMGGSSQLMRELTKGDKKKWQKEEINKGNKRKGARIESKRC